MKPNPQLPIPIVDTRDIEAPSELAAPSRELPRPRARLVGPFAPTAHAAQRLQQRGLSPQAVLAAVDWGFEQNHEGCQIYRIGRRSVAAAAREGVDIRAFEGVTAVVHHREVRTAYRRRGW